MPKMIQLRHVPDDLHRKLKELVEGSSKKKYDKKPLVVSMGSMAASGGYYIAMPGEYLFAEETTMTGSIGVYGSFFNAHEWMKKYGLKMKVIKAGEIKATVLQPVVHLSELAVDQADQYIKNGKAGQDEKQTIDCVLINPDNVAKYSAFGLKD